MSGKNLRRLLSLLDRIGRAMRDGIVSNVFQAEPPLSFIVDSNVSEDLHDALGKALNAGAIVSEEVLGEPIHGSLRGKRCRLSYMLASSYNLPLVLGRPLSLGRLLEVSDRAVRAGQTDLFSSTSS